MALVCPQCSRNDLIQKVSHIYSSGTANSSHTGWTSGLAYSRGGLANVSATTTTHGTSQTVLAQRLAPPSMPKNPHWFWYIMPFVPIHPVQYILVWFAPIGKTVKLLLFGICGILLAITTGTFRLDIKNPIFPNFAAILALAIVVIYYVSLVWGTQRRKAKALPIWQKAMSRWEELYYCARDACVFEPETGEFTPVERTHELLYR